MEEVWQSKCSTGWPAQPSSPAVAGSYNQINMNAQQFYPPSVMQAAYLGGCQMSQQPLLPSSFNSELGKSGNSETGNSFLALLSGNSNRLSGELLHSPNSSLGLARLPFSNGDTLGRSTSHTFSANSISPLSKFHCSDAIFNGDPSSFIASWPLFPTCSKALDMQDCKPLRSHSHILGSLKAVTKHSSEDGSRGMGVSSRRCGSPPLSSSAILHQNSQSSQNSPSDVTVHGFIPLSNFFMGHPRVLCMNTAGELFLNDMGLLEVLCSCHCLPMSVAKFCQHSGLSSANPGEAIRMESGMALAQWCKMCFGNLPSGDLRGPEQSKFSSVERSSFGSKASSFHSLSRNHGAINSVETLGGLGRSEELKNNLYTYHSNLVGHTSMEKQMQNDMNYEHEKRNSVVNGLYRIGIEGLARVPIPVISENNSLHAVKRTSEFMNMKTQHSTSNAQGKNVVSQLFSNDIKIPGNSGNASFSDTPLGLKNFLRHDNDSFQSNSSNEAFGVERSGSVLSLGQPSQHKHSSKSFSSTAMNLPLQSACWSQKFRQQNQLSDKNDCAREVKRARLNQPYPLIEASSTDRGPVPGGFRTTTPLRNSESEDLLTYAKKDSSISLFLSHLTGGTGLLDISSKPHDGVSSVTSSNHYDLLSSKENNSLHTGNEISEAGKAPSFNEFDYFNVKGNPSIVITDNGCNIVGSKINSKQIDDKGVGPPFISGQCIHHCPVGMGKSSLFSSKSLRSLHLGTNAENSNKQGNLFTIDDGCHHNHVVHGSEIRASHCTGLSDCQHSEAPLTCSSINSNYISETSCLSCKRDIKFSDHLDGNLRGLASARHESLMAKHKQLNSSFKMKQHGRLCCHSAVEPHQNSCSDFFVEHKDVNYCEIHKNASDLYSLPNCDCNNHFGASHCKCGSAASDKCCSFAASTQRKTPSSAFSSYHACCSDHHFCFRPRDILIDASLDNVGIHKAGNHPVSGNCCCAIISKCQSGGCSSWVAVSAADTINDPSVNGKLKRLNPTLDVDEAFQKERTVGLDQCSCFKKMAVMQNNCQTGFWRDVSGNIIEYSAAPPDNLVKASEVPRVDRLTETASKKSDTTFEASASLDEGQMSNCSGSSAPVITEVSVEVNKKEAQVSNIDTITILSYSEFDEGSTVDKCSSSVEMLDTGKYKEVPDTCCRVLASKSRRDPMPSHSSANIMNELKIRGSSNQKSARNKIGILTDQENNCWRAQLTSVRELGKRKESSKPFMLDKTFSRPVFRFAPSRPLDSVVEAKCIQSSKRDGVSMHPENVVESTDVVSSGSLNMKRKISDYAYPKFISLKKLGNQNLQLKNCKQPTDKSKFSLAMAEKVNFTLHKKRHSYQRLNYLNGERPPKYMSLSSIVDSRNDETEASTISKRPVVCGNYGIISSGERNALQKPAKIVPLNLVLKKARRCRSKWEIKHNTSLISKLEYADGKDLRCSELSSFKSPDDIEDPYFGRSEVGSGTKSQLSDLVLGKAIKGTWYASIRSGSISENKVNISEQWQMNRRSRSVPFSVDGEALCCVCGSSNQEGINCLLECNQCMIRVHQACYGISKFPQDLWYCRPCKTNSQNIACVLCGYDGGAMTRALRSTNIARSLLKFWTDEAEYDEYSLLPSFGSRSIEASLEAAGDIDEGNKKSIIQETYGSADNVNLNNSIIRGACDPSVTQWVHVVCGLWTPGTRCPNVDTMNAFDVFGVSIASKNIICSVCRRPGGSCIKCRVSNCSVHFHPWCAHQNGLLQSEIEGEDNERVGFYGKCVLHSWQNYRHAESQPMNVEAPNPRTKKWTCARTEGFRGRGRGFSLYHEKSFNDRDGCIVSQVQINAWLHINGQKSGIRGVKSACSDVEYDLRKEYIRYELSKGWKRLVVYKSAIHALGLYTSQFIARGAMVVEYVGEIVGLRVADKREIEYQSGRRLQCKSACYFFRIDKEHIIDATRKGGIARFVNHSCLPNCVAKIISIKNEKKVVFFAERDINPGEEITYDYHFNREDEGKKIPCFCNSKNCRRYLN